MMNKRPNEIHEKLAIIPCIATSYITIKITNIPCNWPAGPYFNSRYKSLYTLIRTGY